MPKFCTSCGSPLDEGAKFCSKCGAASTQTQTPIQTPVVAPGVIPVTQVMPSIDMKVSRRKSKVPSIALGAVIIGIVGVAIVFLITNIFSFITGADSAKPNGDNGTSNVGFTNGYEIYGDGNLIAEPQRLKAVASGDDGVSVAALIGPWEGTRSSINTEYGFSDDGYFYKNVMINNSYSIYHSGSWSYGSYYDTYTPGYWENRFSYTYLDTLIGEYRVKGGVIEFDHVVAISHTTFEDDWYKQKTRSVSIEQLQKESKNAKMQDDFSVEFEFINSTRIRFRDQSNDIDLFWDLDDDEHNVKFAKHEIPAVNWPTKALSADMPEFTTKGRVREASLSYSGDDPSVKAEFKTVTVVIDKTSALSETDAYAADLKKNGWWVEEYLFDSESTYISYDARKGMYKLEISNGRGSGTSADTIVIESTRYAEGKWPEEWLKASLDLPDQAVIVGTVKAEKNDDKNIYETIILDKVNDNGVEAYKQKLIKNGFKKPQSSYRDWELMKYIWIEGELYLAEIELSERMDSLTSFLFDLTWVPDGKWPEIWKSGGLPVPEGIEAVAGEVDAVKWAESLAEYGSHYKSIKFLGMDAREVEAYMSELESSGFTQVKDSYSKEIELYAYLRIDGKLIRVEVSPEENEDIAQIGYSFEYHEDGRWPAIWQEGGLPAPEEMDAIVGKIDLERWTESITDYESAYLNIKFLRLSVTDTTKYFSRLRSLGFRQVEDSWSDETELFNYLRIDNGLYRVEIQQDENDELTELSLSFNYYEDGQWPTQWASAGIPAPSFTAMPGKIDMEQMNESLLDYGSYYKSVQLLGADLSAYEALLRKNGYTEPEYSYTDTWELEKQIQMNGKRYTITIEDTGNEEIPEIEISIRGE